MSKANADEGLLPLQDLVFNTLRSAILTGKLIPGERLMEEKLSNSLKVSRTPVREAIRRLESEGLVVRVKGHGSRVSRMTSKSLENVLEVRRKLDELSVELSCERITDEDLEKLYLSLLEFEKATSEADTETIAKADVRFHDIILKSTGNMYLAQVMDNLAEQIYRYRFVYLKDETKHENLIDEHRKIYEAISERNVDKAKEVSRTHIDNQEKSILGYINKENGDT